MAQNNRRQVFIEEYLKCWNASEAARRAGYANANVAGARLLANDSIRATVQARIDEKAMSADEVLQRLADMARGDVGDFMNIESMSFDLDLQKAQEAGKTHLIKKVRQQTVTRVNKTGDEEETNTLDIELYDAQSALVTLGKHLGIFKDNVDLTSGGKPIQVVGIGINTDAL
jgi:phage terminase small subunit